MSNDEARNQRILELVREILEMDDDDVIELTHRMREDLGMDSLGSLELLSRLSEELRIDMEMEDAMAISTVADACAFVNRNYQEQHSAAATSS